LKHSETKDQTRKGANIKGSNYNFVGDLITKLQNIQWPNQKKPKWRRFHHFTVCNSWYSVIIKEGDVGSDNGGVSKSRRERIAADNPCHRNARWLTKNTFVLWL
jgi:hypothetical protein